MVSWEVVDEVVEEDHDLEQDSRHGRGRDHLQSDVNDGASEGAATELAESPSSDSSRIHPSAAPLFHLARDHLWDELKGRVNGTPPNVVRYAIEDTEDCLSLMHTVISSGDVTVPVDVLRCIEERASCTGTAAVADQDSPPNAVATMAALTDSSGDTPLHKTVHHMPERYDVASFLVERAPTTVLARNRMNYRPIDLLSHRIIMMEEVTKYSKKINLENELEQMWQTVLCLTHSSRPDSMDFQQPLVHSCLVSPGLPNSLLQRAVQRYPEQLREPNVAGDLPLHLAAKLPPPRRGSAGGNSNDASNGAAAASADDGGNNDNDDLFIFLLVRYREAASVLNHRGLSPMELAVQHGHGWESGTIRSLLDVYPAAVCHLRLPPKVLPFLLERLVRENRRKEAFAILRAVPPV
jgi:hypothetical protein